ncbi:MAG: exonuclease SbcCD subunit D [Lachnospiraceae bacterium]|nr:exonuclease SbcCD subunit D [Lachnospiraceae bacterium]
MRFLHTGDLHIGKTVHEFSMLKDQSYILNQIAEIAKKERVDALLIAGDVYDRSVPPAEAVSVFDAFVEQIRNLGITIYVISGNHDSAERLSFASGLLKKQGLIIEGEADGKARQYRLSDETGEVCLYLLPYQKNTQLKEALEAVCVDENAVNILMAHAFAVAGSELPKLSDSEVLPQVGTVDAVDVSLFDKFDYTALGHLHGAQQIGTGAVYYAGSPLKYSFSECNQEKSVWLVETQGRNVSVKRWPLRPLHDMREIEGELSVLIREDIASLADREDYLSVTLTDREELLDAMGSLRTVYPNVMKLILKKNLAGEEMSWESAKQAREKSLPELFSEFYQAVRGEEPDEERLAVIREASEKAMEE